MEKAYFTLRENGNEECPNMGTIGIEYWVNQNTMEWSSIIKLEK